MSLRIWIVGMELAAFSWTAIAAAADVPKLTPAQRVQLAAATTKYRTTKGSSEAIAHLVETAAALGPAAAEQALAALGKDFRPLLDRYGDDYFKAAAGVLKQQQVNPQEVASLRQQVLALARTEGLTKAQIISTSTPALARLQSLLLADPQAVLAAAPKLRPQRERLSLLGEALLRIAAVAAPAVEGQETKEASFSESLAAREGAATLALLPMDDLSRQTLAQNAKLAGSLEPEEAAGVVQCNVIRVLLGLNPLLIDLKLAQAARGHSQDMERLKFFDHTSPLPGKRSFVERAALVGAAASAENIALGSTTGVGAIQQWWESPGHHVNMLGQHRRIGLGQSGRYWTQVFGR